MPGNGPDDARRPANLLAGEKSPYLLQHQFNPVSWRPWGEPAFEAARQRDLPVFLSIGYSTCHWCHVMERESFESDAIAALLNEHFVPIKVDREERPDVDALYMEAVQALTGHGGWPMSVWLTAGGAPFFAGTYFPPDRFALLLQRIAIAWRDHRNELDQQAGALLAALREAQVRPQVGACNSALIEAFCRQWQQRFDRQYGGFHGAPKFPQAADLRLLLRVAAHSDWQPAKEMATTTLDRMARGGIYDQLGGGFARYSVDAQWRVPHFEKMLYDQASLSLAYLEAFQFTAESDFALVTREILDYVLRDMTHRQGGFFSAEDADSEGVEGKFYVFEAAELERLLDDDYPEFAAAFGVTASGNFEHGANILFLQPECSRRQRTESLRRSMQRVLAYRSQRVRPHLDDKILTDWNGLMISSLARAATVLDEPRYLEAARRAVRFLLEELKQVDGGLWHRWRDAEAGIAGFLDDYAFLIQALLDLHQADLDLSWVEQALRLQSEQDRRFLLEDRSDYRFAAGTDRLVPIARIESHDGVVPAGRSIAALNLLRLGTLTGQRELLDQADRLFASTAASIRTAPAAYAQLLIALDLRLDEIKLVKIADTAGRHESSPPGRRLRTEFLPRAIVLADRSLPAGSIQVCQGQTCQPPIDDPERALRDATSQRRYRFAG
jgi:uncharacterized protein YyaL (SSP411 family)